MRVINLASGSDGNLTYIESLNNKILLDDGLSCSETINRLNLIGIKPHEIDAIIVTHEHSDHIKGINLFSNKYDIPIYAHQDVWNNLDNKLNKVLIKNKKIFDGQFNFNELIITPVEVPHDVKCFGFSFSEKNNKISIITDLGHANDKIINTIKGSQLVYLEANYDKNMLYSGQKYPLSLKRRIDGPYGHLSNMASAEIIEVLAYSGTTQIVLSHLSKENNSPALAYTSICKKIEEDGIKEGNDIRIDVATNNPGAFFKLR